MMKIRKPSINDGFFVAGVKHGIVIAFSCDLF